MNLRRFHVLAMAGVSAAAIAVAQERAPIPLPSEPGAAVITFDRRGGFNSPRVNLDPVLTIKADGSVTVVDRSGRLANLQAKLSPTELQELLHFVTVEQDFFNFRSADALAAIRSEESRTGVRSFVVDVSDTYLLVQTADRKHEDSFNAPGIYGVRWNIKSLLQLDAIDKRLIALIDRLRGRPAAF